MTSMRHEDYVAAIDYDEELGLFVGHVVNLSSPITFMGGSVEELRREFATSVETHPAVCRERGITPEKPYSGRFNVRIDPAAHRRVAAAAAKAGNSLNAWAAETLTKAADAA
jgi:predicted HicB family RNase H-like nuclease